jgi:glycosyltransferase involved in cell wall biosynthesis
VKKRIFIAIHYMEIGGAERSLLGLLNAIDKDQLEVDLFVYWHSGEFMALIPKKVKLLNEIKKYTTIERPISEILLEGYFGVACARILAKFFSKIYIQNKGLKDNTSTFQYISNLTTPLLPSLYKFGEYDLAISFHAPHNIVRDKVIAKRKAAWIHTDYSAVDINANLELPIWKAYDRIVAISESAKTAFLVKFPELSEHTIVIENIISPLFVREQAQLDEVRTEMPKEAGLIRLLSVGRYTSAKNFDNVPLICSQLIQDGMKVKWYIIGYGGDEELIKTNIKNTKMEGIVILLGKKSNPYPYMLECDIYVQPSRYEGKAVTVREAQILHKPVVITNFATAEDQLTDGFDGVIVPIDNNGAAEGIKRFIENHDLQEQIKGNLIKSDYGNEQEVEKIYELIYSL